MKRNYETPVAEKVEFQYQEQVVASACNTVYQFTGPENSACPTDEQKPVEVMN